MSTSALDMSELPALQTCSKLPKQPPASAGPTPCVMFAPHSKNPLNYPNDSNRSRTPCQRVPSVSKLFQFQAHVCATTSFFKEKKNPTLKMSLSPNIYLPLSTRTTSSHLFVIPLQLFALVQVRFLENVQHITS